MANLVAWSCGEMKCILQNSASICEYMKVVELHAISLCYVDM